MHACKFLGMQTYCFEAGASSSASKGESLRDTYRTLGAYSDVLIVRSSNEGLAKRIQADFVEWGYTPRVIQAGGGCEFHPTQALLDLYTLWERSFLQKGAAIADLQFALIGDLKFGRAIKSLLRGLQVLGAQKVYLVSKEKYKLPPKNKTNALSAGLDLEEVDALDGLVPEADVFYLPRVQSEYDQANTGTKAPDFSLSMEGLSAMKPSAAVMSPLPRLQELPEELDTDQRAIYWEQEKNGLWVRIALLQAICNRLKSKSKIEEFPSSSPFSQISSPTAEITPR